MFKQIIDQTKLFLAGRRRAYSLVFKKDDVAVQAVLKDLSKFCRADKPTFHKDDRLHAALEGRREVWLRIQQHLNMTPDELWELYGRKDLE